MSIREPPRRHIALEDAVQKPVGERYNVIGVCIDFLPPTKSRGSDETIKFTLSDPSWYRDKGMQFRYFHKTQEGLPAIRNAGDVVILRNLSTRTFGSSYFGISTFGTTWFVLSGSSVRDSTCPNGSDIEYAKAPGTYNLEKLSVEDLQYAKWLAASVDPSTFSVPSMATNLQIEGIMRNDVETPPPRKNKSRLVKELDLDKSDSTKFSDGQPAFADLFGEVRRMYTGGQSCVDLYLTDYTSHSKLYNYEYNSEARDGDEYGYATNAKSWQGPWGKMTIKIFLWDAHGMFVRMNVQPKMFVLIKNCHIKFDKGDGKIEAVCRGDRNNASKVNVTIFEPGEAANDERFRDLLQRKKEYENSAIKRGLPIGTPSDANKVKRQSTAPEQAVKMSKARKRKRSKLAQQAASKSESTEISNRHVSCRKIEVPVTSIDKILDRDMLRRTSQAGNEFYLPFQNAAYKCRARVVDYYPHDIADFAIPCEHRTKERGDEESESRDVDFTHAQENEYLVRWEWRFLLVIEDATSSSSKSRARIPVLVAGKNGDSLINVIACDLYNHPDILAKVRENLFVLWGDLQEKKEEGISLSPPSSKQLPFECLIQEYGIPNSTSKGATQSHSNYQRLFQMFGTTIL